MPPRLRPYLPALCVPALLALALVLSSGSMLLGRKVLASLLLPTGLVWLLLLSAPLLPGLPRLARALLAAVFLLYSAAGSPYLGGALMRHLQKPYVHLAGGPEAKLDVVLVLGAGTQVAPGGRPILSGAGDRVIEAARLYRTGRIDLLVASGQSITHGRSLAEETRTIWIDLGVPPEAILTLPDPTNTRQEVEAFADLLQRNPDWRKAGICTSAWHLRRALGIAEDLDLAPVPADFRGQPDPVHPRFLVPQGAGFEEVGRALWEILGLLAGA